MLVEDEAMPPEPPEATVTLEEAVEATTVAALSAVETTNEGMLEISDGALADVPA